MKNVRIFLSYSSADVNEVRSVAERLLSFGISVWFAECDVLSSNYEAFESAPDDNLKKAIDSCTHAIMFINESCKKREYYLREAKHIEVQMEKAHMRAVCVYPLSSSQPNGAVISNMPLVQFDRNTPQSFMPALLPRG